METGGPQKRSTIAIDLMQEHSRAKDAYEEKKQEFKNLQPSEKPDQLIVSVLDASPVTKVTASPRSS